MSACIHENPARYNRHRVVSRDAYELLVMTWLPGQSSVAHDHAGSSCVLRVVQGTATERTYRVAGDGYVDETSSTDIPEGQIVNAGDDAGIHGVLNTAGNTLVTVHVYSPPLGEFRRYVERPSRDVPVSVRERASTVCVIGGGYSGAMTAANILRQASEQNEPVRVVLVERRGTVGEGVAYGTGEACHLLNVQAGRMSAWADKPGHFLDWARACKDAEICAGDFLPRQWYGQYVRDTLHRAATGAAEGTAMSVICDEARRVVRLSEEKGGWIVHFGRSPSLQADAVVLALGHRPLADPLFDRWTGSRVRWIDDPWKPFATSGVRHDEPVAILGSGLTAIDVVMSIAGSESSSATPPRTAPIWLISRRGLLPKSHAVEGAVASDLNQRVEDLLDAGPMTARQLLRTVRGWVAQDGLDNWRRVVDGVRPHTGRLWQSLPPFEQRRFISRVRPFWEVHRHRMAPHIGRRVDQLISSGVLSLLTGRVHHACSDPNGVDMTINMQSGAKRVRASWVFNCTGPTPSNQPGGNPVVASLMSAGHVRSDDLGLGILTSASGECISVQGRPCNDLLVVGTLRKPATWESTAVPELRVQAAHAAKDSIEIIRRKHDHEINERRANSAVVVQQRSGERTLPS